MATRQDPGPRCVALVGPYLSGKTTLMESMLHLAGAVPRKGAVGQGNTVGDSAPEARERNMSVELNVATARFMDDEFTFLDCPGSIEFYQDTLNALVGVDAAVVVCEPEIGKLLALTPILRHLGDQNIPHILFINKIDKANDSVTDIFAALREIAPRPLILRQIPIREGEEVIGYVDLAHERAYRYGDHGASEQIDIPEAMADEVAEARYAMLETMADFDDHLMEELLEDQTPPKEEIFTDLAKDLGAGYLVPVMIGAAERDNGVFRLLKALRHDVPGFATTLERLAVDEVPGEVVAQVLKTYHTAHGGKLSVARVLRGTVKDGMTLAGERVSGVFALMGHQTSKLDQAGAGQVVALGRMDSVNTGDTLTPAKEVDPELPRAPILKPVFSVALGTEDRGDEVKLTGALGKIIEEDPSVSLEHVAATGELVLWGQGEIHLRVVADRLKNKYGLTVTTRRPQVPYKETIRKGITQRARHKKQTGGHGQFGEVVLEIRPLPRGEGFSFDEKITGGVVPRQYIPSVEAGIKDYLHRGPLGFPVVDLAVTLVDGSYHSVDSSDMAFRTAGRIAMAEALPQCAPVLLEPILKIQIMVPSEFTSKVNGLLSARRGQILGFDARPGWPGWDVVNGFLPQAEMHDLIVELRSLTQGIGSFLWEFDHLAELTGRLADDVIAAAAA